MFGVDAGKKKRRVGDDSKTAEKQGTGLLSPPKVALIYWGRILLFGGLVRRKGDRLPC